MGLPVVNYHFELQSFEPFQSTGSGKQKMFCTSKYIAGLLMFQSSWVVKQHQRR